MINIDKEFYEKVKEKIKSEEGSRNKMYICPAGDRTIGIGHNLDANPISDNAIDVIFKDDLAGVIKELDEKLEWWRDAPEGVRLALVDLIFNLGMPRFLKFKKTIKLLKEKKYKKAGAELLNSQYAKQVTNRAKRNADLISRAK